MKYIVTAYKHVAVPSKQEQKLPGLGKNIKPCIEYTNQEVWDDEGKPSLWEEVGSGKLKGKTAIIIGEIVVSVIRQRSSSLEKALTV